MLVIKKSRIYLKKLLAVCLFMFAVLTYTLFKTDSLILQDDMGIRRSTRMKINSCITSPLNQHALHIPMLPLDYIHSVFCPENFTQVHVIYHFGLVPLDSLSSGQDYVVLVVSYHTHYDFRKAIRKTWGDHSTHGAVVIFVLGSHQQKYWNDFVRDEHREFGDILQVNVPDAYRNLPLKVLHAFHWLTYNYGNVKYLIKADDDVYLYLPNVISLFNLKNTSFYQTKVIGAYNPHSPVTRNLKDDWGVSRQVYLPEYFPPYMSGGSYAMSIHTAKKLLSVWINCQFLHIEDVYITGLLAARAGIGHSSHSGFSFWTSKKSNACDIVTGLRMNSVNLSLKQIYVLHSNISFLKNVTENCFKHDKPLI